MTRRRKIYFCAAIAAGDEVGIDLASGTVTDETTGRTFKAEPFPPFMRELIAAGGLAAYMRNVNAQQ